MADQTDRPIVPVILCGGSGTRLWPLSRRAYPKQLMTMIGENSLLQDTLTRAAAFGPPLVICNEEHRFLVAQQMQALELASGGIVLEPEGRNTAPAACMAALLAGEQDPDALVLLLPSDHEVKDTASFGKAADCAIQAAREGWLVTFGVAPDAPATGYGYVQQGAPLEGADGTFQVAKFVEKPDLEAAKSYLAAGNFAWNSGMFVFSARTLIEEMERLQPEILAACRAALAGASRDADFLRPEAEVWGEAPSISLDYAIMEKTGRAAVVPASFGWSDVGSWDALWQISGPDGEGNVALGDVMALETRNSYLRSDGRLLAAVGIEDMVVVATSDAVLVCPRDKAQMVRELAERLAATGREEHVHHRRVHRPWGSYEPIDADEGFQAKRLIVNPGASISLQSHRHRAEHWVVVRGTAEVTLDQDVFRLEVNQSTHIPIGAVHRLHNPGDGPLHIVEVQCGDYLGEDDIQRFEDIYGRA